MFRLIRLFLDEQEIQEEIMDHTKGGIFRGKDDIGEPAFVLGDQSSPPNIWSGPSWKECLHLENNWSQSGDWS